MEWLCVRKRKGSQWRLARHCTHQRDEGEKKKSSTEGNGRRLVGGGWNLHEGGALISSSWQVRLLESGRGE
jgi:hypothetical protein